MDKTILIPILAILFYFYISRPASYFTGDIKSQNEILKSGILNKNYGTNGSCNYQEQTRVYPSGKIPASYLSLSPQERDTLLKRFVEDKLDNLFDESEYMLV